MASCRRQRATGGFEPDAFRVDWGRQRVTCPAGQVSPPWRTHDGAGYTHRPPSRDPFIKVRFARRACAACALRTRCVGGESSGRQLILHPQPAHASA